VLLAIIVLGALALVALLLILSGPKDGDFRSRLGVAVLSGAIISGAIFLFTQHQTRVLNRATQNETKQAQRLALAVQIAGASSLSDIDLSNQDLHGYYLSSRDLSDASLTGADLKAADLRGSLLLGADLTGSHDVGLRLDGALWDDTTKWPAALSAEAHRQSHLIVTEIQQNLIPSLASHRAKLLARIASGDLIYQVGTWTVGTATGPSPYASFSPDRPIYRYAAGDEDETADIGTPVLNSMVGVPNIGDERTFLNLMFPNGKAFSDVIAPVRPGDVITVEVVIHNDANVGNLSDGVAVAKGTTLNIQIPQGASTRLTLKSSIWADNSTPLSISATATMLADNPVRATYIAGSATVIDNKFPNGYHLADSLMRPSGALVGFSKPDGVVIGGFYGELIVRAKLKISS
jgi:hypothetical protein